MRKVTAEAFEDTSRPEGGHAVILIVGLDGLSDHPTFRLRPVDAGLVADHRGLWAGRSISPLATRQTERGTEFVVGPEIVDNPLLLAGTAVSIEIPEAMVRGEFLWPNVTSLAQPKRRHIVLARRGRDPEPDAVATVAGIDQHYVEPAHGAETRPAGTIINLPVVFQSPLEASARPGLPANDGEIPVYIRSAQQAAGSAADGAHRRGRVWFASAALMSALIIGFVMLVQSVRDKAAKEADELDVGSVVRIDRRDEVASTAAAVLTAPKPAPVVSSPARGDCDVPQLIADPLDGGRMRIRFTSSCRAGEELKVGYGGTEVVRHVDPSGTFEDIVDCFAGRAGGVEVLFADGKSTTVPVSAKDLDRVTKIALVWQAPVNLDLHIFEYASKPDQKGHVWAKAPSDAAAAQEFVSSDHRGHGFISTTADGSAVRRKVEVYTLLHHNEQQSGLITMAVDFETRGETPSAATCRDGALAEVPFQISVLDRHGQLTNQAGILGAAECGKQLSLSTRLDDTVLAPFKVGK